MLQDDRFAPSSQLGPIPAQESTAALPALRPAPARPRRLGWQSCVALVLIACGVAGAGWWHDHRFASELPGIAWSSGRLNANAIDIDTRFAGTVATILVGEGDTIHKGQVVARMDARDLQVSRQEAEAKVQEALQQQAAALAALEQQRSVMILSQQRLQRSLALVPPGYESLEVLDERHQAWAAAAAGYQHAVAELNAATAAVEVAKDEVIKINLDIDESTLVAPVDGRILYRLANQGEVLSSGAKVFTMLDVKDVYMDVFLPASEADRVTPHSDARIVLDAWPGREFPAHVLFIDTRSGSASRSAAETRSERNNLIYRVRVRIDASALRADPDMMGSGQPGFAYVKTDRSAAWPQPLRSRVRSAPSSSLM
jgi:HlyD family secretion protein